jgi:hypothetical protein
MSTFLNMGIAIGIFQSMSVAELKEEVSRLTKAEQLQALELLWTTLSKKSDEIESPEWHGDLLAARKATVDSGEAEFLSVQQLKERLRR